MSILAKAFCERRRAYKLQYQSFIMSMKPVALALLAVGFAAVYSLPMASDMHPVRVDGPKPRAGYCHTLEGNEIKVGEWVASENCTLNCTCVKIEGFEIVECRPWCRLQRTICDFEDTKNEIQYFEEVGHTGCRRCVSVVCDAVRYPGETGSNVTDIKPTVIVNKRHHKEGPYEIIEETEIIMVNPKARGINKKHENSKKHT